MRPHLLLPALLLFSLDLAAQTPVRPPAPAPQHEELTAMARQLDASARTMMNPVATVLGFRSELALTEGQVAALEPLSHQTTTAIERMMTHAVSSIASPVFEMLSDASAPIDEAVVRAAYCEQSAVQADYFIATMRAQRGVEQILTGPQREKLIGLQMGAGMDALRGMFGTLPGQ